MKILKKIAWILVIIGALNWGLVGIFELDLVLSLESLLGLGSIVSKIVYIIVGVSGVFLLLSRFIKNPIKQSATAPAA